MEGFTSKKKLDNTLTPPYPTPSMSTPSSPDILLEWGLPSPIFGPKGGISRMPAKKKAAKKATKKKK
jgi:hypothetical protein